MKKISAMIVLSVIFCFMAGCHSRTTMAEFEKSKAQATLEDRNKALFKRCVEELNKGNITFVEELLSPDYVLFSPSNTSRPLSGEEMTGQLKMALRAFPDLNWSIEELFAVGDRVIARFVITGAHKMEYYGMPATGKKIEYSSIVICRIKNGKIVEEREEADLLGFMRQLNMELNPK